MLILHIPSSCVELTTRTTTSTTRTTTTTTTTSTTTTNLGSNERIALVNLAQSIKHLRQLRRVDGLHGNLQHGACVELERTKDVSLQQQYATTSKLTV